MLCYQSYTLIGVCMGRISTNLGLRIKELREKNNLTQSKLAELINMEASNLSKIERGVQMPKEESIENILNILNVDTKELFDFEHYKPQDEIIENLVTILKSSTQKELQMYYKIINAIKEC